MRWVLAISVGGLFLSAACADAPRRVFVIHAGLHTILSDNDPNFAADNIKAALVRQGVAERDAIVLANPFPVASWKRMFPEESFRMFLESMAPQSPVAQEAYGRLHKVLQGHRVNADDEVVWIGHSAGGQMGMTLAHLAQKSALARYRFAMVVTLGAPVGTNPVPADVKLRHYFSPDDKVVRLAAVYGTLALSLLGEKARVFELPPRLQTNALIRVFQRIEHPEWDDERIVARILEEFRPRQRPGWQASGLAMGSGLAGLLCQALEEHWQVAFEDPP